MKILVLIADAAEAKLFQADNLRIGGLELIQAFSHPESRMKSTELSSDKPGHNRSGAFTSASNPKLVEAEHFAMFLAKEIVASDNKHLFNRLIIVCPAHFHSMLTKHLPKLHSISDTTYLAKDYTKLSVVELQQRLEEQLFG
jgi:protein required for attachment to host cells